jgi:hypothetical protein
MPLSLFAELAVLVLLLLAGGTARLAWSGLEADDARWLIFMLRRQARGRWVRYDLPDSAAPAVIGYPILFHWVLSRFPERLWIRGGFLINAALDLPLAVAAWALARFALLPALAPGVAPAHPWLGLAAAGIVLFAPVLMPPTARLMAFNGRAFGLLVHCGMIALLAIAGLRGVADPLGAAALVGGSLAMIVLVLASQFAVQTAIVCIPAVAIATGSAAVALGPIVAVALAAAVPALGVREPLRYFVDCWGWQYHNRDRNTFPAVRARWRRRLVDDLRHRRWHLVYQSVFLHSAPLCTLLAGPAVVGLIVLLAAEPAALDATWADPVGRVSLAVIAATTLAAIATWFQPLLTLGQSERYLEYGLPAAAALLVALAAAGPALGGATVALVLAATLLVSAVHFVVVLALRGRLFGGGGRFTRTEASFVPWLRQETADRPADRPLRLLTVPMGASQDLADAADAAELDVRVLYDWANVAGDRWLGYMSRGMHGQAFTPEGLARTVAEFDLDGVLLSRTRGFVWDGERHRREPEVILSGFAEDGLHEAAGDDEWMLLLVRRDAAPPSPPPADAEAEAEAAAARPESPTIESVPGPGPTEAMR